MRTEKNSATVPLASVVPRKRYSERDIRNIRIGSVLTMLLYVFFVLIPSSYSALAEIPPLDRLQVTSGELTYQEVGKRGDRLTGIKVGSETIFFTCAPEKFVHPNCLVSKTEYENLAGKSATVWWFDQPIYLFSTQKRLVRLVVAGEEKESYAKTVDVTRRIAKSAPWFIWGALVLFISIVVGFEFIIRRQQHEQ